MSSFPLFENSIGDEILKSGADECRRLGLLWSALFTERKLMRFGIPSSRRDYPTPMVYCRTYQGHT